MGKINVSRVILGGIVAGVVAIVIGLIFQSIFDEQMTESLTRLGLSEPSGGTVAVMMSFSFVAGIVLVWFYAAVRPRFGAGVKTAVIVAAALWVLVSLLPSIQFMLLGIIEGGWLWAGVLFDLVGIIIAAIAGAYVYREDAAGG